MKNENTDIIFNSKWHLSSILLLYSPSYNILNSIAHVLEQDQRSHTEWSILDTSDLVGVLCVFLFLLIVEI